MSKLLVLSVLVGLLAGCGDPDYVDEAAPATTVAEQNAVRTLQIASGRQTPTPSDYRTLDIAPIIDGVSQPDGIINTGDVVLWLVKAEEARQTEGQL